MEYVIIGWAFSCCITAFWLSMEAQGKSVTEFRWHLAGLVFGILVLPFFYLAVRRSAQQQAATTQEPRFDSLPIEDEAAAVVEPQRMASH